MVEERLPVGDDGDAGDKKLSSKSKVLAFVSIVNGSLSPVDPICKFLRDFADFGPRFLARSLRRRSYIISIKILSIINQLKNRYNPKPNVQKNTDTQTPKTKQEVSVYNQTAMVVQSIQQKKRKQTKNKRKKKRYG